MHYKVTVGPDGAWQVNVVRAHVAFVLADGKAKDPDEAERDALCAIADDKAKRAARERYEKQTRHFTVK